MGLFDKFKKRNINKDGAESTTFSHFTKVFKPSNDLVKPTEEELKQFENVLPSELLNFWQEYGFGNYGDGIIYRRCKCTSKPIASIRKIIL